MNTARTGAVRGIRRAGWIRLRRSRQTLERELLDLLGTGRNARITARYYGFDGRGGGSLQTVGNETGLTRERVRQIVTPASERLGTRRQLSPALDRIIAFVADRMPAAAGEIEAELRSQGLTCGLFRLEGVIQAAELLGRDLPFSITEVEGERLAHARDIPSVGAIIRMARRVISRWGMATISHVVAELRKVRSCACDRKLVVSALTCLEGFHWIEQSSDWFWLSDEPDNRVAKRVKKILSVANPINVSELQAGIGRDYRMKGFSPPQSVLLEFCRQTSGLRVNDEAVEAEPAVGSDVLSQAERDIVHILSEHGGTMATPEFKSACLVVGVTRTTFYHCTEYSPIISKRAGGLYGLIGSG